jgi:secreted PhoX family phosphatase
MKRNEFIQFLGLGAVSAALLPPFISSCASPEVAAEKVIDFVIAGISPSTSDDVILAPGLVSEVLLSYGDAISDGDTFGFNNDYTAFVPTGIDEGLLWVNHEYIKELMVSGFDRRGDIEKTKAQADKELYDVGGSIVKIKKQEGKWVVDFNHAQNRRVNGHSNIPFNWDQPIAGKNSAMGTFQNCSGGVTPWGTILTCEENYQHCCANCADRFGG